ncbi:BON domain-containing protein [Salmonirosea aquatica]
MKSQTNPEVNFLQSHHNYGVDKAETDRNLERVVMNALRENVLIDCSKIIVRVTGRTVFLEGKVRFREERMLAQECIANLFGIRSVVNYLTYPCAFSR